MKITALALLVLGFMLNLARGADAPPPGKVLYANPGDNTTGFDLMYGNGSFSADPNHYLLGASGSGWFALPVVLQGDFQLDFDVYGDSGDVDSDIIFANDETGEGIEVNDCPQDTDTPTINVRWSANLCTYESFFYALTTLASAPSLKFPNCTWTHVRITKKGNTLTDDVGGQVLLADVGNGKFPAKARLGLGYYSTQNFGGAGQIRYAHIRVIQLPAEHPAAEQPAATPDPGNATRAGMD